jgi:hypothetical protein
MSWTISIDAQGLVWARVGTSSPGFDEALADSISTLSPRGEPPALSTYWIDRALAGVESGSEKPFLWGNATRLTRSGDEVIAQSDYGLFADERMPVSEFVEGLKTWREVVLRAIREGGAISLAAGVTFWPQRNP